MCGMNPIGLRNIFLILIAVVSMAICCSKRAQADVTITDPSLPPLTGHWTQSPADAFARYAGNLVAYGETLEGEIHLRRISLRQFHNIKRAIDGQDEIIEFDGAVEGNVFYMKFVMGIHTSEDDSSATLEDMAHVKLRVVGKAGKTTGTFPLELESLFISLPARDVARNKLDVVYIRNVESQSSTGSMTITDLGGGTYGMSGYLDAYTEGALLPLSTSHYFQDQNGPVHLVLDSFTTDSADLTVTQSASSPVYPGGNLTYTITVANNNYTSARDIILADALPAGATLVSAASSTMSGHDCFLSGGDVVCTLGSIFGGSPATVKVIVTVPTEASVTNTVRVTSRNPDPNLSNNVSALTTTVGATSTSADLSVAQTSSPNPGTKNSDVTHTVTVANNGPSAASVVLTDILPDTYYTGVDLVSAVPEQGSCSMAEGVVSCNLGSISAGGSTSVAIVVISENPLILSNTATVSSATPDPNRANNTTTLATKVSPTDLTVSQTADPSPATVGSNLTHTITVNNNGPEPVEDLNIVDTIPGTVNIVSLTPADNCDWGPEKIYCRFNDMASGDSKTVTLVVVPTVAGTLANKVELVSSTPNAKSANNKSSIKTQVNKQGNSKPTLGGLTPSSATTSGGAGQTFTAVYRDADGFGDLKSVDFLVTPTGNGADAIWARYNTATNELRLYNDAGTKLLAKKCTPGGAGTLQNSQGKINCRATKVTSAGNNLKVKWKIIPKPAFLDATTPKQLKMKAMDRAGATTGWKTKGSWRINP